MKLRKSKVERGQTHKHPKIKLVKGSLSCVCVCVCVCSVCVCALPANDLKCVLHTSALGVLRIVQAFWQN